jgi:glycosyltransferase involved in cell wall biosynthesis
MGMEMVDLGGRLSIVIPAYNEGRVIYNNILKTIKIVSGFVEDFELVVVNDGSRDNTREQIEKASLRDGRVLMVTSEENHGKGSAILAGIAQCTGDYVAFLDADLELNPTQLEGFLARMVDTGCGAVIGSKLHRDSRIRYPFRRRVMSIGYYCMLRCLFHLRLMDTQTGLKVFRGEAIKPVVHLIRTSGFAYDIEILVAVSRRGYDIMEMPVQVVYSRERGSRRIRFKDVWQAFYDTLAIYGRMKRHYYDV